MFRFAIAMPSPGLLSHCFFYLLIQFSWSFNPSQKQSVGGVDHALAKQERHRRETPPHLPHRLGLTLSSTDLLLDGALLWVASIGCCPIIDLWSEAIQTRTFV